MSATEKLGRREAGQALIAKWRAEGINMLNGHTRRRTFDACALELQQLVDAEAVSEPEIEGGSLPNTPNKATGLPDGDPRQGSLPSTPDSLHGELLTALKAIATGRFLHGDHCRRIAKAAVAKAEAASVRPLPSPQCARPDGCPTVTACRGQRVCPDTTKELR